MKSLAFRISGYRLGVGFGTVGVHMFGVGPSPGPSPMKWIVLRVVDSWASGFVSSVARFGRLGIRSVPPKRRRNPRPTLSLEA